MLAIDSELSAADEVGGATQYAYEGFAEPIMEWSSLN